MDGKVDVQFGMLVILVKFGLDEVILYVTLYRESYQEYISEYS